MQDEIDPTLADRIVTALASEIEDGRLQPEARLLQNEIAARFSASHVPVREAFRRLEAMGLAQSLPRRGVRVAGVTAAQHFEALEMRAALEALALQHAQPHYPPGHLAKLLEADRACSAALEDAAWDAANRDFHHLLIEPCPLPGLMAEIARLQAMLRRGAMHLGGRQRLPLPRDDRDHKAILAALRDGSAERAASHLAQHIRKGHLARIL
ncbi:MAG: GntR family transcriptional regulator [Gemmobacter sp.]|uniref:GntR family transcriptional regulator n=1 Tax=Gemmobacter sp. TaxID=1898957 RepID=UPI001A4D0E49|nr:GntR family transcriptional regulator [Gemmobacter sp.]MBL8563214.1 GntR family transcriptional regulator [Gemmobacter sp.]